MVLGFNKVDKAATDFQQQTGQDMNTMSTSLALFNSGLITSAELIAAASDVTKEFGINAAAAFDMEDTTEIASMKKEMGLAGKEAAKLAAFSKLNGGNIESQNKSIVEGINSANRQNKTAIAHGQVLRDVANVSSAIAVSYAMYPEKLGEAAASARALGMDLNGVDQIASKLLQFETSIAAEMEAELLTGQSLNLEKARQLALDNDLAGLSKELANQGITQAKFSKMNRIQQESQAEAIGMSRDQLADMLIQQGLSLDMSTKGLLDAQKVALEDMKRVDAQEKFAAAIAKLQQALAPVVGFFADILSNSVVIYSVMGVALLAKIPTLTKGVMNLAGGFKTAMKNAGGLYKGIKQMITLKGTSKIKETLMPKGTDKAGDLGKKMKAGGGKKTKENMKGLAGGLRAMGTGPVLKGVVNLGAFAIAGVAAIPSLAFLFPFSLLPGIVIKQNMQALAAGMRSFGKGPVLRGIVNFGALAVASILMIPGAVGLALFGAASFAAAAGFGVLTPALVAFGTAMSTGVGLLGLVAFVGMAIGLGAAFALVGAGALMLGKGISLAAEGFATMVPQLLSLVTSIPALFLLGGALMSIGAGLGLIAIAGMAAIPAIAALGVLGTVAGGLFGGGSGSSNSSSDDDGGIEEVNKNLKKLIALVEAGGDVFIDGSKVGKAMQLSSSQMG